MLSSGGLLIVVPAAVFLGLNVFFIAVRCYTKIWISKDFRINDVGMITVVLTYASLMALLILGVQNGIGSHTLNADPQKIPEALKYIWFLEVIYVVLTSIMKASVAATMLQWAKAKLHTTLLWIAIALDFLICSAFVVYMFVQCTPIEYAWRQTDPTAKGKCHPFVIQLFMGIALCATTVSIDMLFLIVPFFMLRGRGVNKQLMNYIYGILFVGVLASVANFIRLFALFKLKSSADPLFDAAPVFTWSVVEVSLGICVAGVLELGPLMHKYGVKGFENYSTYATKLPDDDDVELLKMQVLGR